MVFLHISQKKRRELLTIRLRIIDFVENHLLIKNTSSEMIKDKQLNEDFKNVAITANGKLIKPYGKDFDVKMLGRLIQLHINMTEPVKKIKAAQLMFHLKKAKDSGFDFSSFVLKFKGRVPFHGVEVFDIKINFITSPEVMVKGFNLFKNGEYVERYDGLADTLRSVKSSVRKELKNPLTFIMGEMVEIGKDIREGKNITISPAEGLFYVITKE